MLRALSIRNFAVVEQLEAEFDPGFTVLTGETGAGKSILLDALSLLRGRGAGLHCDGQADFPIDEGDRVVVRRSEHRVRLLHPKDHDHFAMLRQKLHWSETPERLRP